jgi:hypothetical protein
MVHVTGKNLKEFISDNVDNTSIILTDDFKVYRTLRREFNHKYES